MFELEQVSGGSRKRAADTGAGTCLVSPASRKSTGKGLRGALMPRRVPAVAAGPINACVLYTAACDRFARNAMLCRSRCSFNEKLVFGDDCLGSEVSHKPGAEFLGANLSWEINVQKIPKRGWCHRLHRLEERQ